MAILGIAVLIVGINIVNVAFGFMLLPWHTVAAQIQSGHAIIDKTYNSNNAIYNYEWFKQQYADMQATQNKIQNTQAQIDSFKELNGKDTSKWNYQTKQTYQQLQTTFLGQKSYYEDQVAQYNAKSQMADRNIFKDQLPAHIDITLENHQI